MRRFTVVVVLVAACTPAPSSPALPEGQEGDQCALNNAVYRDCAFPLICRARAVSPTLPDQCGEGGRCNGIAGIQCAGGLVCDFTEDMKYVADAMGTCRTQAFCKPRPAP